MEYKDLEKVNSELESIDFKGKDYVEVNKRVMAFRKLFPKGTIDTNIVRIENGECTFQCKVYDEDGHQLGSGTANEKEGSSFINKTSYIENCETSAVGRALGFLGIGISKSIASSEEVENAKLQQEEIKFNEKVEKTGSEEVTKAQKEALVKACEELGLNWEEVLTQVGWSKGVVVNKEMYGKAMNILIAERKKKK